MKIGIAGRGRLGRSLDVLLQRAGHTVELRGRGEPLPRGEVVLIAVPDAAIGSVARALPADVLVLHCSGATDLAPLASHPEHGSLHPLMTFPGPEIELPDLAGVAAAVAGTPKGLMRAKELAHSLGMRPVVVPGDRRLYHAAAVMAGNFATVLLADAAEVLSRAGVDRASAAELLLPLAIRSLKGAVVDPVKALTGPIARGDYEVVGAHRAALSEAGLEDHRELYELLSERTLSLIANTPPLTPQHRGRYPASSADKPSLSPPQPGRRNRAEPGEIDPSE